MPPNLPLFRPQTLTVHPAPSAHKEAERRLAMNKITQGMAAIALVAALGLIVPSAFGGPASADPKQNDHNNTFERTLYCEIGEDIVPYELVTTDGAASYQDKISAAVLVVSYIDIHRDYTSLDPAYPDFSADFSVGAGLPKGKKYGQKAQTVPCRDTAEFDLVGDGFPAGEVVDVPYHVVSHRTWWVTFSGDGAGPVQVASAYDGGTQSADRPQQSKHKHQNGGGKHRNMGRHHK